MSDATAGRRSPDAAHGLGEDGSGAANLDHLLVDQRQSWLRGQGARIEDYLRWAPNLALNGDALLALIINEFRLRAELGDSPSAPEYAQRFPEYADRLRDKLDSAGIRVDDTRLSEREPKDGPDGTATGPQAPLGSAEFEQLDGLESEP